MSDLGPEFIPEAPRRPAPLSRLPGPRRLRAAASSLSSSAVSSPPSSPDAGGGGGGLLDDGASSPPRPRAFADRLKPFACPANWAGRSAAAVAAAALDAAERSPPRRARAAPPPDVSSPPPARATRRTPRVTSDGSDEDDGDRAPPPPPPPPPPKKRRRLVTLSELKSREASAAASESEDSAAAGADPREADARGRADAAAESPAAGDEPPATPPSQNSSAALPADGSPPPPSPFRADLTDEWRPPASPLRDESSSGGETSAGEALESSTLRFFSEAAAEEIMEFTGCGLEQANEIISMRPFGSPNPQFGPGDGGRVERLRKAFRGCRAKGVSPRLIDVYQVTSVAYREVDRLIRKCEKIGAEISRVLDSWASGGLAANDDNGEGGLHITSMAADGSGETADGFRPIKEQPPTVALPLKGYQLVGVNWLAFLHHRRLSGILADEMGLGKTCQVISFLANLYSQGREGPHLVVVPSSTLENWLREFDKFAPSVPIRSYYGNQRVELRADLEFEPDSFYVLITTYNMAVGKGDRKFLRHLNFKSMVLDEGHLVKNMASSRYKELMRIKAPFRLLLTGTPLQNNLQELMSLLSFVMPSLFVSERTQETLATLFKLKPAATAGSQSSLLSKHRIDRAKRMMTPFVLRRRKDMVVKDLPPKTQLVELIPMTPRQQTLYEAAVKAQTSDFMRADEKLNPSKINNVLMHFRKVADHPLLLRELYTDEKLRVMSKQIMKEEQYWDANPTYIFEDMQVMSDFELHRLCQRFKSINRHALSNNEWMDAGKVRHLTKILPVMVENGDRILIFSIFTTVLDILEEVMATMKWRYVRVDGQTKVEERQLIIDKFNDDLGIPVFLLSTKAGGVGLNLNAANVVVIFNLDFNPQNDKQAEDRAHRVGQKREVRVHRFVSKDTIDEQILRLANAKLKLDKSISHHETTEVQDDETAAASSIFAFLRESWSEKS